MTSEWELTPTFRWGHELRRGLMLGVGVVLILLIHQLRDPSFELVDDDAVASWQPVLTDSFRQLGEGRLPIWSHHTMCGYPLIGWPQPTIVYPLHWLSHGICQTLGMPAREFFVSTLFHFAFAAIGAFVYLRRFGVHPLAATTATIAYALSGVHLGLGTSWPIYVFAASFWPWTFLAIEEIRSGKSSWFWPLFLGLLGGLGFLMLDLMTMVKFALAPTLYFLLRLDLRVLSHMALRGAVAATIALAIGAGQVYPSAEIILNSFRMGVGGIETMPATLTLHLGLIFPFFELPWGPGYTRAAGGFFAGPCALLGLLVGVRFWLSLRGPHRALVVMTFVYMGLSLGNIWQPAIALQSLPGFSAFRWPMRWMLEASAVLALLSGFGLQLIVQHLKSHDFRDTLLLFLGAVVFVVLMAYPAPVELETRSALMRIVWVCGILGVWVSCRAETTEKFLGVVLGWTALAMVANIPVAQRTPLARMNGLLNDPIPVTYENQERVLFLATHRQVVQPMPEGSPQREGSLALSFPHHFGVRTVFGYVYRPPMQDWMGDIGVNGVVTDDKTVAHDYLDPDSHLLETLRVGHVVVSRRNTILDDACRARPDLKFERETEMYRVYRHLGFKRPAFFVEELVPEADKTMAREMGHRLQLSRQALVAANYDGPLKFAASGKVIAFDENHGSIRIEVETPEDGFLVVTTTNFPRWRATIDGAELPIHRVNGSFLGVRVSAGRHIVAFEYRPVDHLWVLAFSAFALIATMIGCFACRRSSSNMTVGRLS